ncbi:helix-hairpin-helix domain-containing protein [Aurantiacibacter aquimixticola]|uniref:Uncharacterized protein n=1 Tax=Aurantiacibacter aquimixticola TaxID=1958945 RepID=A0A419RQ92_9SPHN|nr:helix-hairpin-helix domain-containing protein [Aurantiacibacter aquimixticola]RJY07954.1 hypothetical protein D6201_00020 [Aurantiacibacter aquimixticola]
MPELLQEYWIWIVVALVIGVVVAWWVFNASRTTKVEVEDKADGAPAKRNQALIDAPPAAKSGSMSTEKLHEESAENLVHDQQDAQAAKSEASPGNISAAANTDQIAAAPAAADAEAGAAVPAREAMKQVPADMAKDAPAKPAAGHDDLKRIKGVGPKLVTILHEQGVTSFKQIAAWDDAQIDRIDEKLGRFQGRIRRDDWVEQARLLDKGDMSAYEDRFGKV